MNRTEYASPRPPMAHPIPPTPMAHRLPRRQPGLAYRLLTAAVALECIAVIGWVFLFWLPA